MTTKPVKGVKITTDPDGRVMTTDSEGDGN